MGLGLVGKLSVTAAVMLAAVIAITTLPMFLGKIGNIEEGDRDYPQRNPHPTHFIRLHGTVDSSLNLGFRIRWSSSNTSCRYYLSLFDRVFEGPGGRYFAIWPLTVERQGEDIAADVAIDGVLRGRCGWEFGGISIAGGPALVQTNTPAGSPPNGVVNIRCEAAKRKLPSGEPAFDCTGRRAVHFWSRQTTDVELHIQRGMYQPP